MADHFDEETWLEPLKAPPLANRGFDDRLRARIMRELEEDRRLSVARRRVPPFVALLAVLATVFAVLLVKPGVQPAEHSAAEPAAPPGETEVMQAAEAPEHEWADGLLLGLRTDRSLSGGEEGGRYRTLWIAPEDGRLKLIAEGDGILVPYRLDFWLVNEGEFTSGDQLFARKINIVSAAEPMQTPFAHRMEGEETGGAGETLLFAGQSYAALSRVGANGERESLLTSLDALSSGERITLALDEIAPLSREQALEAGSKWSIVREEGRWTVRTANEAVPLNARASVHDGLCLAWTDIRGAVPEAVDAFCSPGENWIAALTADSLFALPILPDGTLGAPALELALLPEETPVLAEWATGNYVEKWTAFLTALYGSGREGDS